MNFNRLNILFDQKKIKLQPNTNWNNSSDNDKNDTSDWEDFNANMESETNLRNVQTAENNLLFNDLEVINSSSVSSQNIKDSEDNFELVSSGEEAENDNEINLKLRGFNKKRLNVNNEEQNFDSINCSNHIFDGSQNFNNMSESFAKKMFSKIFYEIKFVILLPYLLIKTVFGHIKGVWETDYLILRPVKFLLSPLKIFCPCRIYGSIKSMWQQRNQNAVESRNNSCGYMRLNRNNNAVVDVCDKQPSKILCAYIFILSAFLAGFFGYCWFRPDSQMCQVNEIMIRVRVFLMAVAKDIYRLPGMDCMKAGRCCKGLFEGLFRWSNCLATLPIRALLTAWPRPPEKDKGEESLDNIKLSVDKIMAELAELKDRAHRSEEMLLKMRSDFNQLEKLIADKSNELHKMEPLIKAYNKKIKLIRSNVTQSINQIKNLLTIRKESDKIIESMKMIARDATTDIKASISKLQGIIEADQSRLQSYLEVLEALIKEDETKSLESSDRQINQIKSEVEHITATQEEIKMRLAALRDLPIRYKKVAAKMKSEINANLASELETHDQISKRTECFCISRLKAFKTELDTSKSIFDCYVKKMIEKNAHEVEKNIKTEISQTFYDKTIEIAKATAEEALQFHIKKSPGGQETSGAAFYSKSNFKSGLNTKSMAQADNSESEECTAESYNPAALLNMVSLCAVKNNSQTSSIEVQNNKSIEEECLNKEEMRQMVKIAISKYAADKIGLADFALESMGGSVKPSLSSSTYNGNMGIFSFLSMSVATFTHSLRTIIQPGTQPGQCWPFAGSSGYAVVVLAHRIIVKAVSIDHLPASLNAEGSINSAPRQFNISILPDNPNEKEEIIGSFQYEKGMPSVQTFWISNPKPANTIKLIVLNNHGNPEYTCIYRFRVHGTLLSNDAV